MNDAGLVVIGRNEGERLGRCLDSVLGRCLPVVYVDSGSSDGSVELARRKGAEVVDLDLSIPFTAARARNAGLERLLEISPRLSFVQFVDGDCEVVAGWLETGSEVLRNDQCVAMVCGRNRERYPAASIYNRLCDIEWDTPLGEAESCGGIAMARIAALREVEGFNAAMIGGEEPEMCLRLRRRGWRILRLNAEMTLHDAAMMRFGQWWRRSERGGYVYAEGAVMHGDAPEQHCVREARSIWFWGLILPVLSLGLAWPTSGYSLLLLGGYPLLGWRVYRYRHQLGADRGTAAVFAFFIVLGKIPGVLGQIRYYARLWLKLRPTLIEYKPSSPTPGIHLSPNQTGKARPQPAGDR